MKQKRTAVLRGGPSAEHKVSLESGRRVLESLIKQNYPVRDVMITLSGEWLEGGRVRSVTQSLEGVDVVFIALHGAYGEDGQVQRLLRQFGLPFTGSDALPSALAFNKDTAKKLVSKYGVVVPDSVTLKRDEIGASLFSVASNIKASFGPEYVIKPQSSGSSIGVRLVRQGESLVDMLATALAEYEAVLVEEFIRGKEATVPVLENFRGENLYAFPAIEIIPPREQPFFTYEAKYSGKTAEICPGHFSYLERDRLGEAAILAHTALSLTQLSRSDFIVKDGIVYYLETNTIPGLTAESLLPKAAAAVGLSYDELISHLIETAT